MMKPCTGRLEDGGLCGKLTDAQRSRCPECAPAYERRRTEAEPWRLLYNDPRWRSVSMRVRDRDGQQCTYQVGTRRCISEGLLSVHHEKKLRLIWADCGKPQPRTAGWDRFVREALDMRKLRTLCEAHHKLVDNNNPDEKWLGKPGDLAGSPYRRQRRHRKRNRTRKIRAEDPRRDSGDQGDE